MRKSIVMTKKSIKAQDLSFPIDKILLGDPPLKMRIESPRGLKV